MKRKSTFVILSLLLLAGCATPQTAYSVAAPDAVAAEAARQEQLIQMSKRQRLAQRAPQSPSTQFPAIQRVAAVTERVLIAAAPYCGQQVSNAYAVNVGTADNGPPVVINSGGDLRFGDRVIAINGQNVLGGKKGFLQLNNLGGQLAQRGGPLTLTALRGNRQISATYQVVPACAYGLSFVDNGEWNAYADGDTIHVEARLAQDVKNDDDLAFIISHELSHNILSHVSKQQQNAMGGAMAGLALEAIIAGMGGGSMSGDLARTGASMGGMSYSQEFEREADYVGLYILAQTGYDLDAGPRVARIIAEQNPKSIRYASSHPSSADRAASLQATILEIQQKIRSGQPVYPNAAPRK